MTGRFRKDDRVSHARHGAGTVIDADERYTVIAFDDNSVRKFVTRLVELERSDLPPPVKPKPAPRRPARSRVKVAAAAPEHDET